MTSTQQFTVWIVGLLVVFLGFLWAFPGPGNPEILAIIKTVVQYALSGALGGAAGSVVARKTTPKQVDDRINTIIGDLGLVKRNLNITELE